MFNSIDVLENINDIPSNYNKPYYIKNGCKSMKAINKWNYDYIKKNMNNVSLPTEIYNNKNDMSTTNFSDKYCININKIIENIKINKPPYYYCAEINLHDYEDEINKDIFDDIKSDYDTLRLPTEQLIFFGNNTRSGCHIHIIDDYMLNQIFGKKIIYLFDYNDNPTLKTLPIFHEHYNFLEKDFFNLDLKKYKIYRVILNPGDSILIPPWWFHAVEGIGDSCSITKKYERTDFYYFFKNPYIFICYLYFYYVKDYIKYYILLFFIVIILLMIIY